MNYRHAFHAGNHADVLKHAFLSLILARLRSKEKPFVAIDAFAGAGLTDLALDDRALRTGEWRSGIGRIWPEPAGSDPAPSDAAASAALAPYRAAIARRNPSGALRFAPGSPLLMRDALRDDDKLLVVEAHPEEAAALRRALGGDRRARVYEQDGWAALRSFLPPTPRRGVALIDPPFEAPGEFERLAGALRDGLRRWATGVFALWHPVKDRAVVAAYEAALSAEAGGTPLLMCELSVTPDSAGGLLGSGLAIANPPHGLAEQATALGPALARRLSAPGARGFRSEWLVSPR